MLDFDLSEEETRKVAIYMYTIDFAIFQNGSTANGERVCMFECRKDDTIC